MGKFPLSGKMNQRRPRSQRKVARNTVKKRRSEGTVPMSKCAARVHRASVARKKAANITKQLKKRIRLLPRNTGRKRRSRTRKHVSLLASITAQPKEQSKNAGAVKAARRQ